MLRTIPDTMATPAVAQIDARLEDISRRHGVAIPLAIESGSRAWGFPSPDSDYDCRFVYGRAVVDRRAIALHYLHLGARFRDECLRADGPVSRKKILYALRPAAALRWMRLRGTAVAPMHFPKLLAECDPPGELADAALALIARKAQAAEGECEPVPNAAAAFIASELEVASEAFQDCPAAENLNARREAEAFFRATVQRQKGGC